MSKTALASRTFTREDQEVFALASGDSNPLHMDAVHARRTIPGEPVVHGINGLAWALEEWGRQADAPRHLTRLSVGFRAPILLDRRIELRREAEGDGSATLSLVAGGIVCQSIKLTWLPGPALQDGEAPAMIGTSQPPRSRSLDDVDGACGTLAVEHGPGPWWDRHDGLAILLGRRGMARLLALSRLVGMECPGQHSMLFSMDLDIGDGNGGCGLDYRVVSANRRLSLVHMEVSSGPLHGGVKALICPVTPRPRPDMVAGLVAPGEFQGQSALIVGGSRGLGAATAMILGAGGARCTLTYRDGASEAAELADLIRGLGGQGRAIRLDVTQPLTAITAALGEAEFSHLYYFATPKIFGKVGPDFDRQRFDRFVDVYVEGFDKIVRAVHPHSPARKLAAFYPSTTAIDQPQPELWEYAAAKAAGESYCHQAPAALPGLAVEVERLGRIATDQTLSVIAAQAEEPLPVALAIARRLQTADIP